MLPLVLAASIFFTNPMPLEMPHAEGYLVHEGAHAWFEDRFNQFDLWESQSVDGFWIDDDGREFMIAHLDVLPPEGEAADAVATRTDYAKGRVPIKKRDKAAVRTALAALSPVETPEKETRPRQMPRGMKDVDYWQGTNRSTIVCAYLPEKEEVWRLVTWQLVEGDDFDDSLKLFEREFFDKGAWKALDTRRQSSAAKALDTRRQSSAVKALDTRRQSSAVKASPPSLPSERELLRADARHSVAAYDCWHATDCNEFTILDDLPKDSSFVSALTNELPLLRRAYADALPTSIDTTNVLCVARIFASRSEYLEALEATGNSNMVWSAAYWSPARRELVAYLSDDVSELLSTFRHEAFHQYLSYATALTPVSPWLNEGYAQYFEGIDLSQTGTDPNRKVGTVPSKWGQSPTPEELEKYSLYLPALMLMDYDQFYSGTDPQRRLNYTLAWSLAVFIEKGAPLVRFNPFKNLKHDYFQSLLTTHDMRQATQDVFSNEQFREKFIGEWLSFWKGRQR